MSTRPASSKMSAPADTGIAGTSGAGPTAESPPKVTTPTLRLRGTRRPGRQGRSRLDYRGALNLDADRGQRGGGRAVDDRAVADAERAAVTRAVDGATAHAADGAARMGA